MNRMARRIVNVGLAEKPIDMEELEELLTIFEEKLRSRIEEALGRRLEELDLVVKADVEEGGLLSVNVDVRATGRFIAPLSYDEVLAEAIDEAAKWLEERLRSRRASGEGKETSGVS